MTKPVVLTFMAYYLPGHKAGGPVRTVANMVEALGDEIEFRIVTLDRDLLDESPYAGVVPEQWCRCGKAWVYYVSPARFGFSLVSRLLRATPFDRLYLNSLFAPKFTLLPLLVSRIAGGRGRRVVLAPRGELSPGALSLKADRKRWFIRGANSVGLFKGLRWQASSDEESRMILDAFPAATDVMVARDLPDCSILQDGSAGPGLADSLRVVFLSRISPMKNLDFALRTLDFVKSPVSFDIWGTEEDRDYWATCKDLIAKLPSHVRAVYRGVASHDEVPRIMRSYDLFFLPTRGENYGHAIAEAVSVGTPVLVSDRTPWRGLAAQDAGWDIPLEQGEVAFARAIDEAFARTRRVADAAGWRDSTYRHAQFFLRDPAVVAANRALFSDA